ncbi:MAG: hypothetical protein SNJ75_04270 [Gemmataceae bacterium]
MVTLFLLLAVADSSEVRTYRVELDRETKVPETVAAAVRKELDTVCLRVKDPEGTVRAELWWSRFVAVEASDEQIANGLTYAELPTGTLLGVIRLPEAITDYRKQQIPAGVYTLRRASQPPTGDHLGTAPYGDFALLCAVDEDRQPETIEMKTLVERSSKINDSHPTVLLLFPGDKDATERPKMLDKGKGHWVLFVRLPARTVRKKSVLPLGLTLVGESAAR